MNELIKLKLMHDKMISNDGYLYLLEQQTRYICKKVQLFIQLNSG